MSHTRRRIRLIAPRLQLKLILSFFGVAAVALLLQFILFANTLTKLAASLPDGGPALLESGSSEILRVLLISMAVLLPLTFLVGVIVTFRVAGPLYRFEQHLKSIVRGEDPGPCRIRVGDDLQGFCRLLNAAIDSLRQRKVAAAEAPQSRDIAA